MLCPPKILIETIISRRFSFDSLVAAIKTFFAKLAELGATRIQLDEAALVKDLTAEEKALFLNLYNKLFADKKRSRSLDPNLLW